MSGEITLELRTVESNLGDQVVFDVILRHRVEPCFTPGQPRIKVLEVATVSQQRVARRPQFGCLRFEKSGYPVCVPSAQLYRSSSTICRAARRAVSSRPNA